MFVVTMCRQRYRTVHLFRNVCDVDVQKWNDMKIKYMGWWSLVVSIWGTHVLASVLFVSKRLFLYFLSFYVSDKEKQLYQPNFAWIGRNTTLILAWNARCGVLVLSRLILLLISDCFFFFSCAFFSYCTNRKTFQK